MYAASQRSSSLSKSPEGDTGLLVAQKILICSGSYTLEAGATPMNSAAAPFEPASTEPSRNRWHHGVIKGCSELILYEGRRPVELSVHPEGTTCGLLLHQ